MKICVLMPCYNRPHYLDKVLQSLMQTHQIRSGMPVFLACDGGEKSKQLENIDVALKNKLPSLHCITRPEQYGVGRNVHEAKRFLFEDCGFERIFYVEDDIVISPHYFTVMTNIMKWMETNYSNSCVVGSAIACGRPLEEKQLNLQFVMDCGCSLSNHLMTRECWYFTRAWMSEYVKRYLLCPYQERVNADIQDWMRFLAKRLPLCAGTRRFPLHWDPVGYFQGSPVTSQDAMMALSLRLIGFSHVTTLINRALHIGQEGENTAFEEWKKSYNDTVLDVFEEDNTRSYYRTPTV